MAQNTITRYLVRHGNMAKAVVMFAASLLLLLTLTIPFYNNTREMSAKIVTKKKESQDLADKVSVLSSLDETVLDERVKTLDQALPPRKDVVLYLSTLDGLSRELNINFGGISLSPGEVTEATGSAAPAKTAKAAAKNAGLQSLETELHITGNQDSIYAFLRLIEESVPLMSITDVKVTGVAADNYMLSLKLAMLYAITDITQVKGAVTLFNEKQEAYFQLLQSYRKFEPLSDVAIQDTGLGKSDLFTSIKPQQ